MGDEYPTTFREGELKIYVRLRLNKKIAEIPDRSEKSTVAFFLKSPGNELISYGIVSVRRFTDSTVSGGRAVPVRVKVSNPAAKSMNLGEGMSDPTASIAVLAACYS